MRLIVDAGNSRRRHVSATFVWIKRVYPARQAVDCLVKERNQRAGIHVEKRGLVATIIVELGELRKE